MTHVCWDTSCNLLGFWCETCHAGMLFDQKICIIILDTDVLLWVGYSLRVSYGHVISFFLRVMVLLLSAVQFKSLLVSYALGLGRTGTPMANHVTSEQGSSRILHNLTILENQTDRQTKPLWVSHSQRKSLSLCVAHFLAGLACRAENSLAGLAERVSLEDGSRMGLAWGGL